MSKNKAIKELLSRSIDNIYPSKKELEKKLLSNKKLTVYLGVDPTGPHLHLGHATNLLVMKRFQDLGHKIILLIGDFTARIGDPTDKLAARKPLTEEQVKENLKTFKKQASSVLNFSGRNPAEIKLNSKWFSKMKFEDVLEIAGHFTAQQMIKRDMFQKRLEEDKPINLKEFFYPLMQGYDSVALDTDVEIGGTDQMFNMMMGRDLLKIYKNKGKIVMTTQLLENPKTGNKLMNKSEGGLINLDDTPKDMFGKVMALEDEVISQIAKHSTMMPTKNIEELSDIHPKEAKLRVALEAVSTYYGKKQAKAAKEEFIKVFSKGQAPEEMPEIKTKKEVEITNLLIKAGIKSNNESKRLINQGGVRINDKKVKDPKKTVKVNNGDILQIGKKRFFKLIN